MNKSKTLLEKVKKIFADASTSPAPDATAQTYLKTTDGKIFLVKSATVTIGADVVGVDSNPEATDAVETPIADGTYDIEDGSSIDVKDGKISAVIPAPTGTDVATPAPATPAVDPSAPAATAMSKRKIVMATIIKAVSKWALPVDQDTIAVGTLLTNAPDEDEDDGLPVCAGEYELENGDIIQVNADGLVVLYTPKGQEPTPPAIPAPTGDTSADTTAMKAELAKVKAALAAKEKEVKIAKEEFDKLKNSPAVAALDTKKFEITEIKDKKVMSMIEKVQSITNKK